jgi:hypothetical protein
MVTGILVKASVKGYFQQESFFCSSTELNRIGMRIEVDRVLAKGEVIDCSIFIPGIGRIRADAKVVEVIKRRKGLSRYGLRFVNLAPEHKTIIEGALAEAAA